MDSRSPLRRVRLELARSKEFPSGSSRHGYDIVVPLDSRGHIDIESWRGLRDQCRVRRFWNGEGDRIGRLTHRAGGSEHATWIFDYDEDRRDDDEAGYRFGSHAFLPGEYLTLRDQDGEYTFRVVTVSDL